MEMCDARSTRFLYHSEHQHRWILCTPLNNHTHTLMGCRITIRMHIKHDIDDHKQQLLSLDDKSRPHSSVYFDTIDDQIQRDEHTSNELEPIPLKSRHRLNVLTRTRTPRRPPQEQMSFISRTRHWYRGGAIHTRNIPFWYASAKRIYAMLRRDFGMMGRIVGGKLPKSRKSARSFFI